MLNKIFQKIKAHKREILVVTIILAISALTHGFNMFRFPYYENDEGVYMSQAWSLLKFGELAPYTYWYDHAPAGWIFIALWNFITGGFFTFGFSINSGRVFMLLLHLFSSLFLYLSAKKFTKSSLAGVISVLLFSFSPLGIYFQRRVLLDNIMVFWLMLSLTLILYYKNKLRYIIASAVSFGIAILSKETAIFFIPIYLYLLFLTAHNHHKRFAIIKWLSVMGVVVSFYFLYALFKGELFPYGTLLGGNAPHVSLIEALKFQASRGGGSILDFEKGSFWYNFRVWVGEDPVIIYLGIFATIVNLVVGIRDRGSRIASLLSAAMMFFLMRGGLVIEFYVIPLIPLFALNIAVLINHIKNFFGKFEWFGYTIALTTLIGLVASQIYFSTNIRDALNVYTSDQTTPQIAAVEWMLGKNMPNAFYIIDNYGYIDLQEKKRFSNMKTEWYWKVDRDSNVKDKLLHNDKNNVDYIGLTPQMKTDVAYSGLGLTLAAWKNSRPVASFSNDFWGVDFWGNTNPKRILASAWESYKKYFMDNGRVMDLQKHSETTSEAQSYAMLRSVWLGDRETFDATWSWTQKNLQLPQGLFAWKWNTKILDAGTASDADTDIALALLFAHKKWGQVTYLNEAKKIINAIWMNEVAEVDGISYLTAGNWGNANTEVIINPSYLSPATYRIFAEVDQAHDWKSVVDSSYQALFACTKAPLDKEIGALPPEWCAINKLTGEVGQPSQNQPRATEYAYNAFRTPWRVALDYKWNNDPRAKEYLESLAILGSEYAAHNKLATAYQHDGSVWEEYESVAGYSGNLGYFAVTDPMTAQKIYQEKILPKFYEDKNTSYWEDPKNYYTQNWGWFGTALYSNNLPNLWK